LFRFRRAQRRQYEADELPVALDLLSNGSDSSGLGRNGDRHHDEQLRSVVSFWGFLVVERSRDELDVEAVHLAAILARAERDALADHHELICVVFQTQRSSLS